MRGASLSRRALLANPLPSVPPSSTPFHSDTILRILRCPLPLRLFVFALFGDDISTSFTLCLLSLVRASRLFLPLASSRSARSTPRGIPIIAVEEVIEIFIVSSASRNFNATDIRWSCVIIDQHFFFLTCFLYLRANQRQRKKRVTQRERSCSDSTGSNFPLLYRTIRFFGEKNLQIKRQRFIYMYTHFSTSQRL